ncbi:MAG: hypothetical protein NZ602_10140 [Thermoguttaceae bacterium]|nr:hypothetical protein [Thermoguttaceae bacterium]MDW8036853.1 hypothetical protein [Thermoguttaceae bacterium]
MPELKNPCGRISADEGESRDPQLGKMGTLRKEENRQFSESKKDSWPSIFSVFAYKFTIFSQFTDTSFGKPVVIHIFSFGTDLPSQWATTIAPPRGITNFQKKPTVTLEIGEMTRLGKDHLGNIRKCWVSETMLPILPVLSIKFSAFS